MPRARPPAAPKRGPRPSDVEVGPILLRAAAELVTERGLVEISMRDVAERAGVTPAMITYYFEGKEGLWQALMQAGMTDVRAALAAAPPDPGTPRTIESLFRQLLDTAHARPWMPVLLLRSLWGAPKQRSGFAVANAPINMAMLRALLASGQLAGPRLRNDLSHEALFIILFSSVVFPVLARPVMEATLGVRFDDAFRAQLARTLATLVTEPEVKS